jgi:hypothetical protein
MKKLFIVVAAALLLAPAAFAKGGAVSHVYASPPLDAGSAVPNPDYFPGVGTSTAIRPDDRASWGTVHGVGSRVVAVQAETDGFDWGDAGIGAAGAVAILLVGVGSTFTLRRNRHGAASA